MNLKIVQIPLMLVMLLAPLFVQAKVYLVSVGISDYRGQKQDLRLPVSDAGSIVDLYSKNSPLDYVLLLNEEATAEKITAAMRKVYSKAGTNDIVLFFFSGHGVQGGFVAYDRVLGYREIRGEMSKCKSNYKMIFADACFAGKLRVERGANGANSVSDNQAEKNSNVMLFLSSRSNEPSQEFRWMKNGCFTTSLLEGLRGKADTDRNRIITARELFVYVQEKVVKLTQGQQHPVMWGKFPDDMPVMKW